jgi:hypothetical protein
VTAEPEWTGWLKLDSQNYSHLIIASDGVFEKLTTDDICRVVSVMQTGGNVSAALGFASSCREPAIALPSEKEHQNSRPAKEDQQPSRAVIAVQEVKSETPLPQVDNSHDLKELNVVSQDNERHQLGIEFKNQLPPAAAVSNKNHHPSVVDLASRSESSFAETTNVGFSREVVPARAEVSPKNMAQEIVDAAYLAGSMDNLAALVVPLHPRQKHASNKGQEELVKKKAAAAAQRVSDALRASEPMLSNTNSILGKDRPTDESFSPGMLVGL